MDLLNIRIKDLREEKGLSVEKMAEDIGLAKSTVWAYESGKKQLSVEHLKRIADYFEVSIDGLLNQKKRKAILNLQDTSFLKDYNLMLDDWPLSQDEIAETASFIQVRRHVRNSGPRLPKGGQK